MWLLVVLCGLVIHPLVSQTFAVEVSPDLNYRVANGSIETTSGDVINSGEYIKVVREHNSWAVAVRRLDSRLRPTGPELIASRRWTEAAVENLTIDEVVAMVQNVGEEVEEAGEPPCDCPPHGTVEMTAQPTQEESTTALKSSPRPVPRPANLATAPISSYLIKTPEKVDQYFACHAYSEKMHLDYGGKYRNSIRRMSRAFAQTSGQNLNQDEVSTLMSCLLFRESWGWRGVSSGTGAVGLGQFTDIAINDVKDFISHEISPGNYDRRDQVQRDEHAAGRLSASALRKNLASIDAERKNHERFNELRRLWDSIPMTNRPRPNQITESFMANNANHEAVIALSSLIVRNCQIRLEDQGYEMDAMTSLLACSGGYNMGPAGIKNEALGRKGGPQNLETWLKNLRNSGHRQRQETHNHLVSIHRCMSEGENFPQCGTSSNYCTALPMADQCLHNADPLCWVDGSGKECP